DGRTFRSILRWARSALPDDDAHAGDPFRHQVVVAQLRAHVAELTRGGRGGNPGAHLVRAEAGDAIDLGVGHAVEVLEARTEKSAKKTPVPLLARRRAGPPPPPQAAPRLDHAALARVELLLRRGMAHDQPARPVGRAHVEARGGRIVRKAA